MTNTVNLLQFIFQNTRKTKAQNFCFNTKLTTTEIKKLNQKEYCCDNEIEEFDQCRKKIISSTEIYLSKSQENSISFSRMGIDYYVLI